MKTLQEQIDLASRTIFTDSYSMSIGEIINMYKEKEIDVHPEFQRAFRWEIEQKSSLIESILLGIPMPPIFIFHRKDGIWDVIDGQQRLSTILQFVGAYREENGKLSPPIKLCKTKFLPRLEGVMWQSDDEQSDDEQTYALTQPQRLLIKRAKIDIKLLKSASDESTKYDLFQRLNSGGSRLTPQEVRTCLIIMEDPNFYSTLLEMSKFDDFTNCLPLTERAINEQENIEYIIRFIVARHTTVEDIPSSLHEFLDDSIVNLVRNKIDMEAEIINFKRVFSLLNKILGPDAFKRYSIEKQAFIGATTISAFEAITPAISKNIDYYEKLSSDDLRSKIISLHTHPNYKAAYQRRSTDRYKSLLKIGEEIFNGH